MRPEMPRQAPGERIKNFNPVALGLTQQQAQDEAKRCLKCKASPCVKGCPVEIDIVAFIKLIAEGKFTEAAEKIKEKNNLPAVCGRVCPQEAQCELCCTLGKKGKPIAIGALERFAADWQLNHPSEKKKKITKKRKAVKIAVVGSGPCGLTCAGDLAKMGYQVSLFESLHKPGGVLVYGIPEFRLAKKIVETEIDYIKSLGVTLKENTLIGKTFSLEDLLSKEGYKAVFIAVGAGLPQFLGIPGENLDRVYSANEFLTRVNLMKAYLFPQYDTPINIGKRVAVIGGGNVAFDSARCAIRLGADEVFIVYRRTEKEMPARVEEIENAKEEGVKFHLLTLPVKIMGDIRGYVKGMECLKMRLGEPDASGRRRPLPIEGSEFILDVDTVIVAIGQRPNPLLIKATPELKTAKGGIIAIDEKTQKTNLAGVYAGGDITTGAATVISAMGAGKRAAGAIDKYIRRQHD
ncbi:MAG: NADPH-dependent glutamate synthase [Candidatus Omnitrophota bacterium]|nr:MAG: NADPH-dependent glutamate synthase [Candidatus Omnitrophota bacterium]